MTTPTRAVAGIEGKVAIVTGGTRGIGLAIAGALADAGAEVVVSSRSESSCAEAADAIGGRGVACDVQDPAAVERLFQVVTDCQLFVACAGLSSPGLARDLPLSELERMMQVHYTGAVDGARRAAAQMKTLGGGSIVLVTSVWGLGGQPGTLAYGAAKAALAHAVKVLAIEWARDQIRVNGLAPGFIDTDMTSEMPGGVRDKLLSRVPMRRAGTPEEMAGPAVFLLSDAAAYVTGHTLVADGGERAR